MPNFEYKSIIFAAKFRGDADLLNLDKSINASAEKGWELVSTASVANNSWNYGHTNGILLTFRRALTIPDNT